MKRWQWRMGAAFVLILLTVMGVSGGRAFAMSTAENEDELLTMEDEIWDMLDTDSVQDFLEDMELGEYVTFDDLLDAVQQGEYGELGTLLVQYIRDIFIGQLAENKTLLIQILLLAIVFSVLDNFADVFTNSKIAEVGFFMVFLVLMMLLMKSFALMDETVSDTLENLAIFMKTLLPSFAMAMTFSGNSVTAAGFGELTLFLIYLVEYGMENVIEPLIHGFLVIEFINYTTRDEAISKFGDLVADVIRWMIRVAGAGICGLSVIQNLMAPAVDKVKLLGTTKVVSMIPGIGSGADAVTQLVLGSGMVIKNSIGIVGMLLVAGICLVPVMQTLVMMLLYRAAAAIVEPVADKRITGILMKTSTAAGLFVRLILTVAAMFVTTIAVVVAAGNVLS